MSHTGHTPREPTPTGAAVPPHRTDATTNVRAAKTPVSSTALTVLGLCWGAVMVGLGAVGIHDALVAAGVVGPPAWIRVLVDRIGDLRPGPTLLVGATLAGPPGLVLLVVALRPRRKRGVRVGAEAGTFLRHRHLSRLVASRVETLDGVISARASARRRSVRVRVSGVDGADAAELRRRAESTIAEELAVLDKRVRASVRIEGGTG